MSEHAVSHTSAAQRSGSQGLLGSGGNWLHAGSCMQCCVVECGEADKLSGSTLSCSTLPSCSTAEKRLNLTPPSGLASTSSPVALASSPVASAKKRILPLDFVFSSQAANTHQRDTTTQSEERQREEGGREKARAAPLLVLAACVPYRA